MQPVLARLSCRGSRVLTLVPGGYREGRGRADPMLGTCQGVDPLDQISTTVGVWHRAYPGQVQTNCSIHGGRGWAGLSGRETCRQF